MECTVLSRWWSEQTREGLKLPAASPGCCRDTEGRSVLRVEKPITPFFGVLSASGSPGKNRYGRCMAHGSVSGQSWVRAACLLLSQLSRDRIESCMIDCPHAAGSMGRAYQVIHKNLLCGPPKASCLQGYTVKEPVGQGSRPEVCQGLADMQQGQGA